MAFDVSFTYRIIDNYSRTIDKIHRSTARFGKKMASLSSGAMKGFAKRMGQIAAKGSALASALGVAGAGFAVDKYADLADSLAKFSKQIGTSANTVAEWQFAAERSGISADQMGTAMQRLYRNVGDLKIGTGELKSLLDGSPVFRKALTDAKTFDEQIDLVVGKLSEIKDPATKAAAAAKFFGERIGPKMIPLINEGLAGTQALRDEFQRLHGGYTQEGLSAAERYQDTVLDLGTSFRGLRDQIGAAVLPALTDLMDTFKEFVVENRELIATKAESWFKSLADAINNTNWDEVRKEIFEFLILIKDIAVTIGHVIQGVGGFKTAILGLGIAAILGPALGILSSIATILTAIGLIPASIALAIVGLGAAIWYWWDDIYEVGEKIFNYLGGIFDGVGEKISNAISSVSKFLGLEGQYGFDAPGVDSRSSSVAAGQGNLSAGSSLSSYLNGQIGIRVDGPGEVVESSLSSSQPGNLGMNVARVGPGRRF